MFEEYKNTVLQFYQIKKGKFLLSYNLESPGREKLRKECVSVFLKKNSKADKDFIQSFFDPTNIYSDQVRSIERFNLDKFRPLVSFLTSGTKIRDEENIKLLAWLIDFPLYEDWRNNPVMPEIAEPDPSASTKTSEDDSKEPTDEAVDKPTLPVIIVLGDGETKGAEHTNVKELSNTDLSFDNVNNTIQHPEKDFDKKSFSTKKIVIIGVIILFIGTGLSLFWQDQVDKETITRDEKCMYWTGGHYEAIACNKKTNVATLPLDTMRLRLLERITQPDTLTKSSLGKVWYGKVNGKPIFYTAGGEDPLDSNKRLLPVTSYMLTKYTSYYRYLLTIVVWLISIIAIVIVLCKLAFMYFLKRRKSQ